MTRVGGPAVVALLVVALVVMALLVGPLALSGPPATAAHHVPAAGIESVGRAPVWAQDSPVRRLAGSERTATAAAIALDGWDVASTTVVVDGWDPVAALVGAHLAARLDAPVLLGATGPLPLATATALDALGSTDLVVVGAAEVADDAVSGTLTRVTAANPSALAVAALEVVPGTSAMPVLVASQATFADALSAANLGPARLLLTDPAELSAATAEALEELAAGEVVVVGGEAAVGPAVADAIRALGAQVSRLAGPDRYGTSVAAERPSAATVVLASGQDVADAIAAVPWAARRGASVLLTTHDELPTVVLATLEADPGRSVVVLGGRAAVGDFVDRQAAAAMSGGPAAGFTGGVRALTAAEVEAMDGVVWRPGCPVALDALRVVDLAHWTFEGDVADGRLVVQADHAADVLGVMGALFDARFPLAQVVPAEAFGGDDDASMAVNNTSAFNCRVVAGTATFSEHAYGAAVDLNPVQNPYVRGDVVEPEAGRQFLDRADVRPGMIVRPGPVVGAFEAIGWGWGADFSTSADYQHFSATGR